MMSFLIEELGEFHVYDIFISRDYANLFKLDIQMLCGLGRINCAYVEFVVGLDALQIWKEMWACKSYRKINFVQDYVTELS